jgi:hypothetical protein
VRRGDWSLCSATGWPEDESAQQLLCWCWQDTLVVVNWADAPAAAHVWLPWSDVGGRTWELRDLLSGAVFERAGDDVAASGLYVQLPPWGFHVLEWTPT